MDLNNLPANSHKSREEKAEKEERKKLDKVVTGTVHTKKRSKASKFTDAFVSENSGGLMDHTVMDILVPTIKNTILDIVWDSINIMFFGDTKSRNGRGNNRPNSGYVSYRSYSDNNRRDDRNYNRVRTPVYEFDDIFLETRGEAEDVLDSMEDIIDEYGSVTVADLNDLIGITGNYTDNKYGWKDLRNARIERVRGGDYTIKFPKVVPIK